MDSMRNGHQQSQHEKSADQASSDGVPGSSRSGSEDFPGSSSNFQGPDPSLAPLSEDFSGSSSNFQGPDPSLAPLSEDFSGSSSNFQGPDPSLAPTLIVLGMAGSGKTTFVQQLCAYLHARKTPPYVVNLDPAVRTVPYSVNLDIRDTVNYKEVMQQYMLGPNGAILTCLNLFCTSFDKVIDIVRARSSSVPLTIVDTPGQIEAFTWSASGQIITDTFASSHPTVIAYICDSSRTTSPTTFMSNMLYACSILYKTKLPFFVVFNKADIVRPDFAQRWMTDFEAFGEALEESRSSYSNDLARSLSLVLDEFYADLTTVAVSAKTGLGMEDVLKAVESCTKQYRDDYVPMYAERRRWRAEQEKKMMEEAQRETGLEPEVKKMGLETDGEDEIARWLKDESH